MCFTNKDGYKLLSGSHDRLFKVTNLGVRVPFHKEALILNEHEKDISNVAYSGNGLTLVTASFDNYVVLNDLARIERIQVAKLAKLEKDKAKGEDAFADEKDVVQEEVRASSLAANFTPTSNVINTSLFRAALHS